MHFFPGPPHTIFAFAPGVDANANDGAGEPASASLTGDVAAAGGQKTGALVGTKFPLSGSDAHAVVQSIRLPELQGCDDAVADLSAAEGKAGSIHIPRMAV